MSSGESDQLKSEELEALLNAASPAAGDAPEDAAEMSGESADASAPAESADDVLPESPTENAELNAEELLDQVEADLASAVDPALSPDSSAGDNASHVAQTPLPEATEPFELQEFDDGGLASGEPAELQALEEVELDVRIELGQAELLIDEVLQLREGSVVPLDKLAGDPVDILVNGRLIARGEVLVLNENFCVRVAEILTPEV